MIFILLQLKTTTERRGDKIESQQTTSGAIKRRARYPSVITSFRAKYSQQAGSTQHPQTQRKLPPHQELLSK